MNVREKYKEFCLNKGITFEEINSVASYDDSTLFCPAGMQKYKAQFLDKEYRGTYANIQSCIRMNDFDEIGDGKHLLNFNMMGLFSFRKMTMQHAIDFWLEFVQVQLGLKLSYVTIHPNVREWASYYPSSISTGLDSDCVWTDGALTGFCTEFYVEDIEVGNIVNLGGDCIDVGFGLERLQSKNTAVPVRHAKTQALSNAARAIINSGYTPSNVKQGYVLRKIIRELYILGYRSDDSGSLGGHFQKEVKRQEKIYEMYKKLLPKHPDKSKAWWWDTHGIKIDEL